jgi:DNA-binding CsgD family transcriptional regulator
MRPELIRQGQTKVGNPYCIICNYGRAVKTLLPVERRILFSRAQGLTLTNVAKNLGKTRERIAQIEHRAYRKLRHPSRVEIIEGRNELCKKNVQKQV